MGRAAAVSVYAWRGLDRPLFEVAFVDLLPGRQGAEGPQLGPDYRLDYTKSRQRYVPLARRLVRFRWGSFSVDIEFDADGVVVRYPGLAERVS